MRNRFKPLYLRSCFVTEEMRAYVCLAPSLHVTTHQTTAVNIYTLRLHQTVPLDGLLVYRF